MTYFYNSNTGDLVNESPPSPQYLTYEAMAREGIGWHIYGTLQQVYAAVRANHWPPPNSNAGGASPIPGQARHVVQSAVTDFWKGLNLENWLLRIGEVFLGIVLVGVGIAKLTGTTNFVASAVKTKLPL